MNQAPPSGWAKENDSLTRTVKRKDFVEAMAFLLATGRLAEAANHHPDIDLRYNQVRLSLTTHSAGHQLTDKDFALAEKINGLGEDDIRSITQELRQRFAA